MAIIDTVFANEFSTSFAGKPDCGVANIRNKTYKMCVYATKAGLLHKSNCFLASYKNR